MHHPFPDSIRCTALLALAAVVAGCAAESAPVDAGAGPAIDAALDAAADAGSDSSTTDTGPTDAGAQDTGAQADVGAALDASNPADTAAEDAQDDVSLASDSSGNAEDSGFLDGEQGAVDGYSHDANLAETAQSDGGAADDADDAVDAPEDATDACQPTGEETCDGVDNDCDGQTDELTCDDDNNCTKDTCAGPSGTCSHDAEPGCVPDAKLPYKVDFACGGLPKGWSHDTSLGSATGPQWAVDSSPKSPSATSGACSLNFNNGVDYQCPDDKPLSAQFGVFGAVHSRVIDATKLAKSAALTATMQLSGSWQAGATDDLVISAVRAADGSTVQLATLEHADTGSWALVKLDLQALSGSRFWLRAQFATKDCAGNEGSGPFIDDLHVFDGSCASNKECDDGNPCTEDKCKKATNKCSNEPLPSLAKCDDGDPCTTGDHCAGGGCEGTQKSCHDGNACTADSCKKADGSCVNQALANTTACDDGSVCTTADKCDGKGACKGTLAKDGTACDDGDACLVTDICTKGACKGSKNAPDGYSCSDDSGCTIGDACKGGKCAGVPAPNVCNDLDPCTKDSCAAAGGLAVKCSHAPANDGDACDDGNACTAKEKCTGGKCGLGAAVKCDDNNPCTDDSCAPASGCAHKANTKACDDGEACTEKDTCGGGKCAGTPKTCGDGDPCTIDACVGSSGACKHDKIAGCDSSPQKIPYATAFACGAAKDKNWTITAASSGPKWAVDGTPAVPKARSAACSLNFNNGKDYACPGNKPQSPTVGVSGTADTPRIDATSLKAGAPLRVRFYRSGRWDAGDKLEVFARKAGAQAWTKVGATAHNSDTKWTWTGFWLPDYAGSIFQLRLAFTTADCSKNTLSGAFIDDFMVWDSSCKSDTSCNDNNDCTSNKCNKTSGWCAFNNDPTAKCSDNNACTSGDKCVAKKCTGTAKKCTDGKDCTTDSCNTKSGACEFPAVKDGATCSDGVACTTGDSCKAGACSSGKADASKCDDHNPCTADACAKVAGKFQCTHKAVANSAECKAGKPTVTWVWNKVLKPECSPCHVNGGGSGGLALGSTPQSAWTAMVGKKASGTCTATNHVTAGKSADSSLWRKIDAKAMHGCGTKMPRNAPLLPPSVTDAVKLWIDSGAPK